MRTGWTSEDKSWGLREASEQREEQREGFMGKTPILSNTCENNIQDKSSQTDIMTSRLSVEAEFVQS